ncbi:hypothetical protein SELMODRAFT_110343 [Selaginella moellendorffii]|uniref:Strictosidine synthase conserved region domain-containing protein n=1 Tax=Selaginella moellendorffii TaxID=88036 RepID=D8S7M3_SELML|nr:protein STRICTOSIDINE SYNTHASE-LIKE 5 [Selaginella moellendorffii]EFJ19634.1 hypothetical protein SELMODRAFT_110343 [Selaginella moellendorffii]|eukprot:XP_002979226.1 protein STRICTOSIDINE SYNTHASE-LIKE 5 [Selaginella moellendorffii]
MFAIKLLLALSLLLVAILTFFLAISRVDPLPAAWNPAPERQGIYAANAALQRVEKIGVGFFSGAEDLAVDQEGRIYSGGKDGWIKRYFPATGRIENWIYVGGHPLGMAIGKYGELIAVEPVMGLLNVTDAGVEILSNEADGLKYKIADELVVARDNTIYFTDASTKFDVADCRLDILESRPNGRILKFDPSSRTTSVLLKDLYFPNGVALSRDENYLVFCETSKARCRKYWLRGEKMGSIENFLDNLPAFPDNIHINAGGNFWIALVSDRLWHIELISNSPLLKKLVSHLVPFLPDESLQSAKVLAVDPDGRPLEFYEDPTGKEMAFVTSALQVGDHLYLGNLAKSYIGRIKLSSREKGTRFSI